MSASPASPDPVPSPAPISGVGSSQNQRLFRIYLVYRTLLSAVFILLLALPATRDLVENPGQLLYGTVSVLFLISNVALLTAVAVRWTLTHARLVLLFSVDIGCITLLSDASGGMVSGLPLLLTITVAASAVMITNRTIATLVAALAVLAMLADTLRLVSIGEVDTRALLPAGLLGILFFAVSAIMQLIVLRLGHAEAIAQARASDIQRLQRLNEEIVRRLQAGVLLVEGDGSLKLLNDAARRLLDPRSDDTSSPGALNTISPELTARLDDYRQGTDPGARPFQARPEAAQVLARFASVDGDSAGPVLVFLEDYTPLVAHAQSLKLHSLGRLAGSIAHEIRNPLGAISHAAQLLQESEHIAPADRRMLDMVLGNSQRVNEIVESVMQVSRREPPRPVLLELASWLTAYCQERSGNASQEGELTLEQVQTEAQIRFDPEHLQRILDNLVDNAMRYGEQSTGKRRAVLRMEVDDERGECTIDVCDEGPGVSEADRPRLFEPFFTRSRRGSGLGLYLCRELCELNEARIAYSPDSDGNSRFRISVAQQE